MSAHKKVFIVDDQAGEIRSLIRRIKKRGYDVVLATNEREAERMLQEIAARPSAFAAAIFDVMVATVDFDTLLAMEDSVDLESKVFEPSVDTGLRLCRYARETLRISEAELPIAALSVRTDDELRSNLETLGVPLYDRTQIDTPDDRSIMRFVERHLPEREEELGSA